MLAMEAWNGIAIACVLALTWLGCDHAARLVRVPILPRLLLFAWWGSACAWFALAHTEVGARDALILVVLPNAWAVFGVATVVAIRRWIILDGGRDADAP
jgi:hypothetical protein